MKSSTAITFATAFSIGLLCLMLSVRQAVPPVANDVRALWYNNAMASLPPADWQGLNPDLLHLCLLRAASGRQAAAPWSAACSDIVHAASTCKRWRAILTPRFWKELCIQQWPSAGVLAQSGAIMDFFAYAKALYRQQQHLALRKDR